MTLLQIKGVYKDMYQMYRLRVQELEEQALTLGEDLDVGHPVAVEYRKIVKEFLGGEVKEMKYLKPYKQRRKHRAASDEASANHFAYLCRTSKGIRVSYTYRAADFLTKKRYKRVFNQQFATMREYAMWWTVFQPLVLIGGETWPRQWARTPVYQPTESDPGVKPTSSSAHSATQTSKYGSDTAKGAASTSPPTGKR